MENLVNFWKNKKVLLTGHTGFKGSWLALWLNQLQAQVVGYALEPPTKKNLFTEASVANDVIDVRGDIRNYAALEQIIKQHQPDVIFHMAAQPLVRFSYINPIETYTTNVIGTVNLLEAARYSSTVRAIVNITTDKCYENKEWHWGYRESEPMGGHDPYSSSKGCAELVTQAYRHSYFHGEQKPGLASARAGNVIGGGDWAADRLIPDLINACVESNILKIRYPNAIRPWQHVLEPLAGYLLLAEALYQHPEKFSEGWNFGPYDSDAKPVSWVADEVIRLWGSQTRWQITDECQPHEAHYLKLDCSKAQAKLLWKPKWTLQKALQATVRWYQAYYNHEDVRSVTLHQIKDYMQLL